MKPIYKHYDQEALDVQYNNRLHVPDYATYLARWEQLSAQTVRKLPAIKDIRYGDLDRERLDIYPAVRPDSKVLVFIHGGYWHLLDRSMFQFIADGFHAYGVTTVLVGYPMAPEVSIDQIVLSCRSAIRWLYRNLPAYHADPDQIYVSGHSAGGHLAAMLMATDWKNFDPGLPPGLLKGTCTVSGLFNLDPIRLSNINKVLNMDAETARRNSPVFLDPSKDCPLIIAVGEAETAEFKDQSRELDTRWKNKGIVMQLSQLPAQNHFSIVETVVDPRSSLHQALRGLMNV